MSELKRANRIAIEVKAEGFIAKMWRTHKLLCEVSSKDTTWVADKNANKTTQREDYRAWIMAHAEEYGIEWKPEDMRTQENTRKATYTTNADLEEDAIALMEGDIAHYMEKCPYEVSLVDVTVDDIVPVAYSTKGYDLTKMDIEDGKYLKNGNWAWANIDICYTLLVDSTTEIYVTLQVQLVSGQLKKATRIGDGTYCQTAWNTLLKKEIEGAEVK